MNDTATRSSIMIAYDPDTSESPCGLAVLSAPCGVKEREHLFFFDLEELDYFIASLVDVMMFDGAI